MRPTVSFRVEQKLYNLIEELTKLMKVDKTKLLNMAVIKGLESIIKEAEQTASARLQQVQAEVEEVEEGLQADKQAQTGRKHWFAEWWGF